MWMRIVWVRVQVETLLEQQTFLIQEDKGKEYSVRGGVCGTAALGLGLLNSRDQGARDKALGF